MSEEKINTTCTRYFKGAIFFLVAFFFLPLNFVHAEPRYATTTVNISICGDGFADSNEVCDDGFADNDGTYGSSIAGRRCLPDCTGFGAYCGDTIVHFLYSEECDDGDNSDGDLCSAACTNEEDPINTTDGGGTSGGGDSGRGGAVTGKVLITNPTKVLISGKAYPSRDVHILKDGKEIAMVSANSLADFSKQFDTVTPGAATFGFWADDALGLRSITFTTTFQITQNAVTTISGIHLPPTIKASGSAVKPGEMITFSGTTVPNATVFLHIDKGTDSTVETKSDGSGLWETSFDTKLLTAEAFHTAKASFSLAKGVNGASGEMESGFGQTLNFYVGEGEGADAFFADLNVDGRVNIVDFSILLFSWNGTGGGASPSPDINHDGIVNLTDFSIMIFYWTG